MKLLPHSRSSVKNKSTNRKIFEHSGFWAANISIFKICTYYVLHCFLITKYQCIPTKLEFIYIFLLLFSCSVVPGFPVLSPRACSDSCWLSRWCHPAISSSNVSFSCLQSFPASISFKFSVWEKMMGNTNW